MNHAAIRLLIFNNRIEIINPGCLYGGLTIDDIKLGVSRQRNPLMADFAAKTMIYRGLGSGIVRAMREDNHIDFDNEVSANQFKVTIWRTTQKSNPTIQKKGLKDSNTIPKSENTTPKETLKDSNTVPKSECATQKETLKNSNTVLKALEPSQSEVLKYIMKHPKATREEIADSIDGVSFGSVKFIIGKLQQKGLLKRVGGRKYGEWQVLTEK